MAGSEAGGAESERAASEFARERLVPNSGWGIAGPWFLAREEDMTAIDPELERHRRTWIGFTRLIKYALAIIVIILILMAIFLL